MNEPSGSAPLLPFVTSPCPDEILGSWLGRIRIENGGGAWRTLLEHVGFGRRIQTPLFDAVDYNEKLGQLLIYLGTTYERALLELSTLPYWLTFSATESGAILPGTLAIPALRRAAGADGEVASIRALGTQRFAGKSLEPRYCPQCISDDSNNIGQAYWHRAHQLPNVFFCHKHQCELQVKCPKCSARSRGSDSKNLPPPSLLCQCGYRLDKKRSSRIPSTMELRLAAISVEALNQGVPGWNRDNVFDFMRTQLTRSASYSKGRYQSVLAEAFSEGQMQWSSGSLEHGDVGKVRFRRYLSAGSAPECCGLLAALDVNVQTAIAGFKEEGKESRKRQELPAVFKGDMTIEKSRSALKRASRLYPSRPISSSRRHYWYLMLNDQAWLWENFPRSLRVEFPSVAEDRLTIIELLSSTENPLGGIRLKARTSPAGYRATIRDKKWLDEQNLQARRTDVAVNAGIADSFLKERAAALHNALGKLLSSEERPVRIFASTLAPFVGLSPQQAADTVKRVKVLAHAIEEANADKLRRQLLWGGKQMKLSGARLSKKQLGRVAGVPTAHVSDEIFAEVNAVHYSK